MEAKDGKVQVFGFRKWDAVKGEYAISQFKATLESINMFRAEPIEDSGEIVDRSQLDKLGRVAQEQAR